MPVIFSHTSLFRKLYQYTTIGMVSSEVQVESFIAAFDWYSAQALEKNPVIEGPISDDQSGPMLDFGFWYNKIPEAELTRYLMDVPFPAAKKIDEAFKQVQPH